MLRLKNCPKPPPYSPSCFLAKSIDEEKFEIERKIILNELAEVADDPMCGLRSSF
jgi:predicted Zn-dependent peptidase